MKQRHATTPRLETLRHGVQSRYFVRLERRSTVATIEGEVKLERRRQRVNELQTIRQARSFPDLRVDGPRARGVHSRIGIVVHAMAAGIANCRLNTGVVNIVFGLNELVGFPNFVRDVRSEAVENLEPPSVHGIVPEMRSLRSQTQVPAGGVQSTGHERHAGGDERGDRGLR